VQLVLCQLRLVIAFVVHTYAMIVRSHVFADIAVCQRLTFGCQSTGFFSFHILSMFSRSASDMPLVQLSGFFKNDAAASPSVESGMLSPSGSDHAYRPVV
jgi:hypothetical protein